MIFSGGGVMIFRASLINLNVNTDLRRAVGPASMAVKSKHHFSRYDQFDNCSLDSFTNRWLIIFSICFNMTVSAIFLFGVSD